MPEQIAADKSPYYDALEKADEAFEDGNLDLSALEGLLEACLADQLLSAFKDATDPSKVMPEGKVLH